MVRHKRGLGGEQSAAWLWGVAAEPPGADPVRHSMEFTQRNLLSGAVLATCQSRWADQERGGSTLECAGLPGLGISGCAGPLLQVF